MAPRAISLTEMPVAPRILRSIWLPFAVRGRVWRVRLSPGWAAGHRGGALRDLVVWLWLAGSPPAASPGSVAVLRRPGVWRCGCQDGLAGSRLRRVWGGERAWLSARGRPSVG